MDRFIRDDLDALTTRIAALGKGLVAFDGRPGAGKTTLARLVAGRLGCGHVDGDAFLVPKQDAFLDALRVADLRAAIDAQLQAHWLVLLSCVCAQAVVKLVGIEPVAVIWIERSSPLHIERDERDFAGDHHADAASAGPLYAEVEGYVAQHRARETCSAVYLNAHED